jgi:O-antigen/teichoic acid export membrane protein
MRVKLEHRHHLLRAISNAGWLFGDQILRMVVGLLVGVWVARYLGPKQFGLLNYAMAFVALFGAIASLGLNGIVVRDLVREPVSPNATLGTAFLLQIIGGLLAFSLAVFVIGFARPDDDLAKLMVAVLGFVMVFKSTEVVKYWFESQVQSKYSVWVENGAFLLFAVVKVTLILCDASIMAFAWAVLAEGGVVAAGLLGIYAWRGGHLSAWCTRCNRAMTLLKDSWPLILSGLAIMIYMRIDQIMLGQMLGDQAVGVYSAAVRVSEVWYFVPIAIANSVFPSIIKAKGQGEMLYRQQVQRLFNFMSLLALMVALPMSFLSAWTIHLLFGDGFVGAGDVLAIHIWAGWFVFLGVASGKWFLVENLQRITFYRTLAGAVLNIVLNVALIPRLGISGAAWATVISQAFASVLFNALGQATRPVFYMQARAMLGAGLLRG